MSFLDDVAKLPPVKKFATGVKSQVAKLNQLVDNQNDIITAAKRVPNAGAQNDGALVVTVLDGGSPTDIVISGYVPTQ